MWRFFTKDGAEKASAASVTGGSSGLLYGIDANGNAGWLRGMELLYDSGDAGVGLPVASLSITLPQVYRHLKVVYSVLGTVAGTNFQYRFNNDSSGSYYFAYAVLTGGVANPATNTAGAQTAGLLGTLGTAENTAGVMDVPFYSTNLLKNTTFYSYNQNDGGGNQKYWNGGCLYNTGTAITSLQIIPAAGNIAAGSRISVYGY